MSAITMKRALSGVLFALATYGVNAQTYPNKPVRVIVPVPAGSGMDVVGRIAVDRMAQNLGVPFVVENVGGAGGAVGGGMVARAAPDGYTLLIWSESAPLAALANSRLQYHPVKDLIPVGSIAKGVFYLSVNPSLPARTVAEFVALAKSQPGKIAYGTSGVGSPHHVVMEMFIMATGIELLHVPYKGSGDTVTALMRGDIQSAMGLPSSFAPHLRSGKFRGLAVAAPERSPTFPDLPTVTEAGVRGVEYLSWYALFAPAGTPEAIMERLHAEMVKVVTDRGYIDDRLAKVGLEPYSTTPLALTRRLSQQYYDMLEPVVRKAGIRTE